jgi:hypothetical protein
VSETLDSRYVVIGTVGSTLKDFFPLLSWLMATKPNFGRALPSFYGGKVNSASVEKKYDLNHI